MMDKNTLNSWKKAQKLIDAYLDVSKVEAVEKIQADLTIKDDVKSILIKLVDSLPEDDTKLVDADLSFFNAVGNNVPNLSGTTFGNYQLLKRIGKGGMSHVYEAIRLDSDIQKPVALKILYNHVDELDQTLRAMFIQEQEILSKLDHPHIIAFQHGGISDNGIPFLVMEYIENALPIDVYCKKNKCSQKQIIEIAKDLAQALSYAHSKLVVHKDIKPNNILFDSHGNFKVADFGIAAFSEKEVSIKDPNDPKMYTPDYASPEQIQGTIVTPSSDIFSLTAVMLGLLTHEKPLPDFKVEDYKPHEDEEYVRNLLVNSRLDNDLKNIITKGLKIDANKRYQSMVVLFNDLDNWLNIKPVTATKSSVIYKTKKFIKRHVAVSFVAFALIASIITGMFLVIEQRDKAQLEAKKAKQVSQFLIDSIGASDPDLTKGKNISVIELLKNAKLKIQEASIDDKLLNATLQQTIGSALIKVGEYSDAEMMLKAAIKTDENNLLARINLSSLYLEQKQFENAKTEIDYLNNNKLNPINRAKLQLLESQLWLKQGKFKQAKSKIEKVIESAVQANNNKLLIESFLISANISNENGDSQTALTIIEKALSLSNDTYGEFSTSSTTILSMLANKMSNINGAPWKEIEEIYLKTIQSQEQLYGANHPRIAKTYLNYGFALKTSKKLDQARIYGNKALVIAIQNFGELHILTAHINLLLSQLDVYQGKTSQGITAMNKVVSVYEKYYGVNHYETNQVKTTQSIYLLRNKQPQLALKILKPLYQSQKKQLGETNKATLYTNYSLVQALLQSGFIQESVKEGERALALSQESLGAEAIVTIGTQGALALSYLKNKQFEKSIKLSTELVNKAFVKKVAPYFKKYSTVLILAHCQQGNIAEVDTLISEIIDKYYQEEKNQDATFNELIKIKASIETKCHKE